MTKSFDELVKHDKIYFEIKVKDIDRAKKFYHDVFGMDVFDDAGEDIGWCSMCLPVPGAYLALQRVSEDNRPKDSASLVFSVFNIEAVEYYLKKKGIDSQPITDLPDMVSLLVIKDFDENTICFASPPRVRST